MWMSQGVPFRWVPPASRRARTWQALCATAQLLDRRRKQHDVAGLPELWLGHVATIGVYATTVSPLGAVSSAWYSWLPVT